VEPVEAGLIQRIEDEFQISIAEEEMPLVRTAGDLHRLVMSKLVQERLLIPSRALYLIRRALAELAGVLRRTICPATFLETVVPADDRAGQWIRIARSTGVRLPLLRHSARWKRRMILASMAISFLPVVAIWWALYALDWIRGIFILLFCLPAAVAFLLLESRVNEYLLEVTRNRATQLPYETVQELVEAVEEMNAARLLSAQGTGKAPSGDIVWAKVAELIRQTGMAQDEIVPATPIPELLQAN
jgi:hypothetical protein